MNVSPVIADAVRDAVAHAPVVDLHTHLFAPEFGSLNLWGIDELLTYHYLIAEVLRAEPYLVPEQFLAMPKPVQADLIWDALFVRRTPLSEATTGVVRVLKAYGLNPHVSSLKEARAYFADQSERGHLDHVLRRAGVTHLTMTNDPLDPAERRIWDSGGEPDPRFLTALRIDPVLNGWAENWGKLAADGYRVQEAIDTVTLDEVRRFLDVWIQRMRPRYLAVSLPYTFAYPASDVRHRLLTEAVLPTCRDHNLPMALMMGANRQVNPRIGMAGDGIGVADLSALEGLARDFPDVRFLVTTLARENVQTLCVIARKFANVLPFGCWWFMNNPTLVEETTKLRLELLGPTFVPQHSDARILDQLIYKWDHSRRSIANALIARYGELEAAGWTVSRETVQPDARLLMGGLAAEWLGVTA